MNESSMTNRRRFLSGLLTAPLVLAPAAKAQETKTEAYMRHTLYCAECYFNMFREPKVADTYPYIPGDCNVLCCNPHCSQYNIRYKEPRFDVVLERTD